MGIETVLASVIVPFFNEESRILKLLESLAFQTLPQSQFEVILIDNASTDGSGPLVRSFTGIEKLILLEEPKPKNPYNARNRGIRISHGSVLAFTDADCIVDCHWLERGIDAIQIEGTDLLAGRVRFFQGTRATAAEIYDSVANLQQSEAVASRGGAFTANLFVHKRIFDEVGTFGEGIEGGGDLAFTTLATSKGYRLRFDPTIVVSHPAREMRELLRKAFRVGRGKGRRSSGTGNLGKEKSALPPHFQMLRYSNLRKRIVERELPLKRSGSVYLVGLLYVCTGFAGLLVGWIQSKLRPTAISWIMPSKSSIRT